MQRDALSGRLTLLCLLTCAATLSCALPGKVAMADDSDSLPESVNQFAEDLYHGLGDKDNLVFSPASLATAMGMAYAGADGQTASQMAKVLHVTVAPREIHRLFGDLTTTSGSDNPTFGARCRENDGYGLLVTEVLPATAADRVGLNVKDLVLELNGVPVRSEADWAGQIDRADQKLDVRWYSFDNGAVMQRSVALGTDFLTTTNAVWSQRGLRLLPQYIDLIKQGFSGNVGSVDFRRDASAARSNINRWISEQTGGKVTDFLSPQSISREAKLVLTNTVNFKGAWQKPFPESDYTFNWVNNLRTRTVPAMQSTEHFKYVENETFQALELPYADNPMAMVVVLPRKNQPWSNFRKRYSLTEFAELGDTMRPTRVQVQLPKFSFPLQMSLRDRLEEAMPDAFSERADFSGISRSGDLRLHDIIHQAFIAVDEAGTEASAASAVVAGIKQAAEAEFVANRPFVFLLVDRRTGVIWFAGQLVDPPA